MHCDPGHSRFGRRATLCTAASRAPAQAGTARSPALVRSSAFRRSARFARLSIASLAAALALAALAGCTGLDPIYAPSGVAPPAPIAINNPAWVPMMDRDHLWDQVVDVVNDYFRIDREERVRLVDNVLTEGRIDTIPLTGATLMEPWRHDSASQYEKLESTLQSIRRRAIVRVIPAQSGYLIDVAVFKELEDVSHPEVGGASRANLRNDNSLNRRSNPLGDESRTLGWIPQGRDPALEQEILAQLQARLGNFSVPQTY